jgi:hypothetical protein
MSQAGGGRQPSALEIEKSHFPEIKNTGILRKGILRQDSDVAIAQAADP